MKSSGYERSPTGEDEPVKKKGCCSCRCCPRIRCPRIRCPKIRCPLCCVKILPCFRYPVISCQLAFAICTLALWGVFAGYTTVLIRKNKAEAMGSGGTPTTPPPMTTTAIPSPTDNQEEPEGTPRMWAMADRLVEAKVTPETVLTTDGTPQNRAFMWLVNDDERQVHPNHPNLVQRYALATLYFATEGHSWSAGQANSEQSQNNDTTVVASPRTVLTTNWLTSLHECEWMFVSCKNELAASEVHDRRLRLRSADSNKGRMLNEHNQGLLAEGTVVGLDLDHKNLIGHLPPEIGALESIKILDLASNALNGAIPVTVGSMKELQILRLDNNYFNGTIPDELGSLTKLEELRLENNNELTGAVPLEVCNLMDYSSSLQPKFTFPEHLVCPCCDESGAAVARKKNEAMSGDVQQEVEELEEEVEELEEEVEQLQQEVKSMPEEVTTASPTESSTMQATTVTPAEPSAAAQGSIATPTEPSTVQPNDKDVTPAPLATSSAATSKVGTNDGVRKN